jgi:hypothetical protein
MRRTAIGLLLVVTFGTLAGCNRTSAIGAPGRLQPVALNGLGGWLYNRSSASLSVTLFDGDRPHTVAPGDGLEIPSSGGPPAPWHIVIVDARTRRVIGDQTRERGDQAIEVDNEGVNAQAPDDSDAENENEDKR